MDDQPGEGRRARRSTVLLVDSDPVARRNLAEVLRSSYEVIQAANLAEARARLADSSPSLMVVAHRLSDGDGLSLVGPTPEPDLPVVMLAETPSWKLRVEAIRSGAIDSLAKAEVDVVSLHRTVAHALERGALRTELRMAEEIASRAETRLQALFGSSLTGVLITTPDGDLVACNRALVQMLGYDSAEDLLELGAEGILADAHDRGTYLEELHRTGEVALFENRLLTSTGETLDVLENSVGIYSDSGELLEIYACVVDVTERRQADFERDLLAEVFAQAAEALIVTDADGLIEHVNEAFEAISGYSAEEAIGQTPRMISSGEHDEEFYADLWQTILGGDVWSGRMVNKQKDGTLYWVDATISPLRGKDGRTKGFLGLQKDITREIELENSLQASAQLEALGQLAGGIAHDFNNLMTVVLSNVEQCVGRFSADSTPDELADMSGEVAVMLDEIAQAALAGRSLTKDMLAFGRQQKLHLRVLALNDLVRQVEPMLRRSLGEDILVELRLDPTISNVKADPAEMQSVLLNLCINARDAMADGGTLKIETGERTIDEAYLAIHPQAKEGRSVYLSVADTGLGMDEETREHIFKPFFTTKGPGRGSGMGLARVYGTVKQSGGNIWVYSEPGQGSVFKVHLPAVSEGTAVDVAAPSTVHEDRTAPRIALVEDNEAVRRGIRRTLEHLGYTVAFSMGPEKALSVLVASSEAFDLLVTDMVMPGTGGLELAAALAPSHPELRVLFVSGHPADTAFAGRAPDCEHRFLEKPFTQDELDRAVQDLVQRRPS